MKIEQLKEIKGYTGLGSAFRLHGVDLIIITESVEDLQKLTDAWKVQPVKEEWCRPSVVLSRADFPEPPPAAPAAEKEAI